MIKVCQKKFPPFKRKNGFLAMFVILPKSQKWPKIHFLFRQVEIFFGTPYSFGETKIFHLLYFLIQSKKRGKIEKKSLLCMAHFFSFWPKMPKISIFMKKSFSMNFMKVFYTFDKHQYLNPLEPFC